MTTDVQYTHVELLTLNGPEYRRVSTAPPRLPTEDEIPIIDLSPIDNDLQERKQIAARVRAAAENTGFFYVKNHGIPEDLIQAAFAQAQAFFNQSEAEKQKIASSKMKQMDGFHGVGSTQINKTETKDRKETFSLRYNPHRDPQVHPATLPAEDQDNALWDGTAHLPGFRETTTAFYQARLALARKMIRIFALALHLPEDYFDELVTHPGADGLYVHYPGTPDAPSLSDAELDVGIGSHTDIQCVTLLWQDNSGGLQVLSANDEWLDARPVPGTLVVNIGDFLQRLSNNRFRSTVHRVYNRQTTSRYSMPFFLGFNPESVCRVVPSCVDDEHPPLYEPISCGQWHRDRLALAQGRLVRP
ncbi:isopenicillin N synthase family dioxygenase [Aspergillus saccharolyticus JOP 1030-1]|uniref:2OG-Fe(II) oxygenase superfamily protein n=1 Tax=Aspergillus saccharolyticus JOP 1030-1 TaxID=1450539 RepID=A0A318ZJY3_9EURO|nr:2OG-Fe(II) oxygenase superfamily protein [Aspergillus saccharolyticus JOP 1030-1]PYH47105.1 2OG-Fe(II) oxygenase superfamily protein [Aspergillus saccharolyticus JOP 1030-1]